MNRLALGDGFRDDRAAGSAAGSAASSAAGKECMTRRLQIMSRPTDKTAEARKKNELTTGTDRGRLAVAATGPVCGAARYSQAGRRAAGDALREGEVRTRLRTMI